MKFLLCVLLVALSCQVILCEEDVFIVRMVNSVAPQLVQDGIAKGDLPGGPYYVHHLIKSSIGAQDSHLTIDVRRLDNQTNVTIRATVSNDDFSVKSSCLTRKIGKNIMALSQGWPFAWQNYAPNGRDEEICRMDIYEFMDFGTMFELSAENLALDSVIKSAYEAILNTKTLFDLDPNYPPGPVSLSSSPDFLIVWQYIGRSANGEYDWSLYRQVQPCTGDNLGFSNANPLMW